MSFFNVCQNCDVEQVVTKRGEVDPEIIKQRDDLKEKLKEEKRKNREFRAKVAALTLKLKEFQDLLDKYKHELHGEIISQEELKKKEELQQQLKAAIEQQEESDKLIDHLIRLLDEVNKSLLLHFELQKKKIGFVEKTV